MSAKSVYLLHRMTPANGKLSALENLVNEWFDFLKAQPGWKSVERICSADSQVVWMEEWASKADVDAFNQNHVALSDHMSRMVALTKDLPNRVVYQKL